MFIDFPDIPDRPDTETQPDPIEDYDGGTIEVGTDEIFHSHNIDNTISGSGPLSNIYTPPYGSAVIHMFSYDADAFLINTGTIWNYSTLAGATGIFVENLENSGIIVAETEAYESDGSPGSASSSFFTLMACDGRVLTLIPLLKIPVPSSLWRLAV